MQPRKGLAVLLLVMMVTPLFIAAPAGATPSAPVYSVLDSLDQSPQQQVESPNVIEIPPTDIHNPEQPPQTPEETPPEAPEEPPPEAPRQPLALKAYAHSTAAKTLETIRFSAVLSGGKGASKYALWVYRDGEKVEYFPTGTKGLWDYVPQYPGLYHGQVVGKDGTGREKYANTGTVTVTLNQQEQLAQQNSPVGKGGDDEG